MNLSEFSMARDMMLGLKSKPPTFMDLQQPPTNVETYDDRAELTYREDLTSNEPTMEMFRSHEMRDRSSYLVQSRNALKYKKPIVTVTRRRISQVPRYNREEKFVSELNRPMTKQVGKRTMLEAKKSRDGSAEINVSNYEQIVRKSFLKQKA
jgi:hypothetical protein